MKSENFIPRFLKLALVLPSTSENLTAYCRAAIISAESRGWIWYDGRGEWKLTQEGKKVAKELGA